VENKKKDNFLQKKTFDWGQRKDGPAITNQQIRAKPSEILKK